MKIVGKVTERHQQNNNGTKIFPSDVCTEATFVTNVEKTTETEEVEGRDPENIYGVI